MNKRIYNLTFVGIMIALSAVLAFVEGSLPPLVAVAPGIKLGLSNIAVMYTLLCVGRGKGVTVAVFKSLFIMLTMGITAGIISLSGGLASVLFVLSLSGIFKEKISYYLLSVSAAVAHNLGQAAAAYFLVTGGAVLYYIPILIIGGILCGSLTAILLKAVLPILSKYDKNFKGE